jgi:hypothetical protein
MFTGVLCPDWELMILDADPPEGGLGAVAVGVAARRMCPEGCP